MWSRGHRINYKLKQNGVKWEDTPIFFAENLDGEWDDIKKLATNLAMRFANSFQVQVRWEFEDIGQGHYIDPTGKMLIASSSKHLDTVIISEEV